MLLLSTSIFAARPILPCEAHPDRLVHRRPALRLVLRRARAAVPAAARAGPHGALHGGHAGGPAGHVCDAFHFSACAAPPGGEVAAVRSYTASGCGACVADVVRLVRVVADVQRDVRGRHSTT